MSSRSAIAVAMSAYVIAGIGAALFMAFVHAMGLGIFRKQAPDDVLVSWIVNLGLLLAFALQHSGMARRAFKDWLARWIAPSLERSTYVVASGIVTGAIPLGWQALPGEPIWRGPIWIIAISVLAACFTGYCCLGYDSATFLGWTQATTGVSEARGPLRIDGAYRYVRHPLMLGFLGTIWAMPVMPPELLMLNVGLTAYILIAIRWEERELVRDFGAAYEEYRRRVPALIPWRVFV